MKGLHPYFLLLILFASSIHAQDSHYWTQQFGTRSALLGGAVLGGAEDNTMIYYNPGALGFLDESSISINANAYRIESIRVENALGNEADFQSSKLGSVPLLAGGMIRTGSEKWKVGYAFISPVDFNFKGIARAEGNYDLVDDSESPGLEETVAEAAVTNKTSELIVAIGLGHQINENWSVGVSNLFTVRSLTYQKSFSTYVFLNQDENSLVGTNFLQNADYYNVRYAAKFGVVFQKDDWDVGLTLTTPSINLFGQGTVASNIAVRNLKLIDENRISGVATARQAELKTKYKSPFSVALGTNYTFGRSHLGVAAQYYAGIDIYDVMEPAPGSFVRPIDLAPQLQSDEFLSLQSAAESVFNIAIGYEYEVSESLSILGGVRSDMSYFNQDLNEFAGIKPTISNWDIYHFSGGVTLNRKNSSLSLGLLLSAGSNDSYEQSGSFDPENPDLVAGATTITKASYSNFGLLLGYTFYFKKFSLNDSPGADD
ncbi:hypothetical protein [Robiginitalea sp.]|uniref:hypothetical protein n=1 Tax=Robiginitalea sp. TaxID=1902411 RepID=UPI003C7448A6